MRRAAFLAAALAAISAGSWIPEARAAREGTVDVDTDLLTSPDDGAPPVTKLRKGQKLAASNVPTGGFYKVRTAYGEIGWVAADALVLGELPSDPDAPEGEPQTVTEALTGESEKDDDPIGSALRRKKKAFKRGKVRIRALGGMTLFGNSQLADDVGIDAFSTGFNFGGEFVMFIHPMAGIAVRVETLMKKVVGTDQDENSFQFNMSSLPVMLGLQMEFVATQSTVIHASFMLGKGLGSSLSVTSLPAGSPTEFSSAPFAGLFKLDVTFKVSKSVGIFLEAGYRELRMREQGAPIPSGDGSALFQDSDGNFFPVTVDFSGPVVGAGISIPY